VLLGLLALVCRVGGEEALDLLHRGERRETEREREREREKGIFRNADLLDARCSMRSMLSMLGI